MPELPEVQTIVNDLKKFLPGLEITDIWTDIPKFKKIKKGVIGKKILAVKRRGKNILINITDDKTIIVHQKMTGHLMFGKWVLKNKKWASVLPGAMQDDPENRFIHFLFFLSNGNHLALCDMRKFATISINSKEETKDKMQKIGLEPIGRNFDFKKFCKKIKNKKGRIKTMLMNQNIIAGIGNIYSDEILWLAKIHPLKKVEKMTEKELRKVYLSIKPVLNKAIKARGSSYIDYRDALGEKGQYQEMRNAYGLKGKKCKQRGCDGIIERIAVGGRSAHFCNKHQLE